MALLVAVPDARDTARHVPSPVYGEGSPLGEVDRACGRIAPSDATVLLTGETGTGKEIFARLIHGRSRRASAPFVAVNCGAIPESLLESELFGYVRGAFTGATTARQGRIAVAQGGTLFLDEIGELPMSMQVKLLRVLQERSYEPVGTSRSVYCDFRLVAATNRDLVAEVEAGRFRRDLYYRLLVCQIELPPLRRRRGDVAVLFEHFWRGRGEKRPVQRDVLTALEQYAWPGNIRELENLVERLSVCVEGLSISLGDLPPAFVPRAMVVKSPAPEPITADLAPEPHAEVGASHLPESPASLAVPEQLAEPIDLSSLLRQIEDGYIDAALVRTDGNRKAAADLLGLQRTTLVEKLRRRSEKVRGA